eukprot:gene16713-5132_t
MAAASETQTPRPGPKLRDLRSLPQDARVSPVTPVSPCTPASPSVSFAADSFRRDTGSHRLAQKALKARRASGRSVKSNDSKETLNSLSRSRENVAGLTHTRHTRRAACTEHNLNSQFNRSFSLVGLRNSPGQTLLEIVIPLANEYLSTQALSDLL